MPPPSKWFPQKGESLTRRNSGKTSFPEFASRLGRAVFPPKEKRPWAPAIGKKIPCPRLVNALKTFTRRWQKLPRSKKARICRKRVRFCGTSTSSSSLRLAKFGPKEKIASKSELPGVLARENGKFQENLKIPKIWAFYGTRANLKVS